MLLKNKLRKSSKETGLKKPRDSKFYLWFLLTVWVLFFSLLGLFDPFASVTQAVEPVAEVAPEENGGLVGLFGLDIKLFIAQLLNFALALFILWRFIIRPFSKTLQERQAKIESGLKYAQEMEEERQKLEHQKKSELRQARDEAQGVIKAASEAAEKIKSTILGEAQAQAEKLIEKTKGTLAAEKEKMVKEVKVEVAELVALAAEKIVGAKIDSVRDRELIAKGLEQASNSKSSPSN